MREIVAEVSHLSKRYGAVRALNDLSMELAGPAVGLLGPNGAGKTTLVRVLLGLVRADGGEARVLGLDAERQALQVRQRVGYMPEDDCQIPHLSAVEYVAFCGEMEGLPARMATQRAHEVLDYVGIEQERYRTIEEYSAGMKQRVKLGQALVGGPEAVLLDEPTSGLDPRGRAEMLELIAGLPKAGVRVVFSSHLLADVEAVCGEVVVLARGQVRLSGALEELRRLDETAFDVKVRGDVERFRREVERRGLRVVSGEGEGVRVAGERSEEVIAAAAAAGVQLRGLAPARRSLEEVFLEAVQSSEGTER